MIKKVRVNAPEVPKVGDFVCWKNHGFNVWRVIKIGKGLTDEIIVITLEADESTVTA